jgi:protein-S-isoprenylcysteine O-methyltransferase Ste14
MSGDHSPTPAPASGRPPPRLPPLAVAPLAALAAWLAARAAPALGFDFQGRTLLAVLLAVTAVAVGLAGVLEFRRARTTVNPLQPGRASSLVTGGIYRRTRNPMYVAVATLLLAWALWLGNALAPLGAVLFVAWMDRLQIPPEERALGALFGAEFERYRREVRRWL